MENPRSLPVTTSEICEGASRMMYAASVCVRFLIVQDLRNFLGENFLGDHRLGDRPRATLFCSGHGPLGKVNERCPASDIRAL